jgi:hypothetical protein
VQDAIQIVMHVKYNIKERVQVIAYYFEETAGISESASDTASQPAIIPLNPTVCCSYARFGKSEISLIFFY